MSLVSGIIEVPMAPLMAAGLDWLEAVLPAVFVIFWIVSQIAGVLGKVRQKGKPLPQPQVQPARPVDAGGRRGAPRPQPPRPAGAGLDAQLREQIEQFLKERPPESIELEQVTRSPLPVPPEPRPKPKQRPPQPPRPAVRPREVRTSSLVEMPHLASSLQPQAAEAANPLPSAASVAVAGTIAGLLADPRSLRQAIVLREVLDRPVERWS